jgi:2-dehydropantoate 2-reductase
MEGAAVTIAVVGAGPIGALIAAALTHAGHPALLIDVLPARLAPVRRSGLRVVGPGVQYLARPATALAHEAVHGVDVAFLDVPHRITPAACQVLDRLLAPGGTAVSLQHGLHAQWVAELLGRERTIAACAGFEVALPTPTDVAFTAGTFVVGAVGAVPAPHHTAVADLLRAAGFAVALAPDVRAHLWSAATITALTAACAAAHHACRDASDEVAAVARELSALAAAYGVELQPKAGLDLTAFAPGRPPEACLRALHAWRRPTEPDPQRPSWRRQLDGLAPAAALAERIGHPLPTAGPRLDQWLFGADRGRSVVAGD